MTTKRSIGKILGAILLIIGIIIIGISIGIARAHALGTVTVGLNTVHGNLVFQRDSSRASAKAVTAVKKEVAALNDKAYDVKQA